LQRSANAGERQKRDPTIPPSVSIALGDPGTRLEPATRQFMERGFGHDFSAVRVHTGGRAAESAREVGATAFTLGQNIVFSEGQYAPTAPAGQRLLAHELAHVVQQARSPAAPGEAGTIGPADHPLEREATTVSQRVLAGGQSATSSVAAVPALQRQAAGAPAPAPAAKRDTHTPVGEAIPPKAHATSNWNMGAFDSQLDWSTPGAPCILTLRLKVAFDFVDTPAGFPGDGGHSVPGAVTRTKWTSAEQNEWRNTFIREVTSRWSYRYPLVPVDPDCMWGMVVCDQALARVEVIPVAPAGGVPTIKVSHALGYRSRAGGIGAWLARGDINAGAHVPGQVTVEHEFGHMIGLDHSSPACQSTDAVNVNAIGMNTGANTCYGVTPAQIADIMGQGSIVTTQDYRPFVVEMGAFTGCAWKTVGNAPSPPKSSWLAAHAGLVTGSLLGAAAGAALGASGGLAAGILGGVAGLAIGALAGAIVDKVAS
jgi:hypothetical protein